MVILKEMQMGYSPETQTGSQCCGEAFGIF